MLPAKTPYPVSNASKWDPNWNSLLGKLWALNLWAFSFVLLCSLQGKCALKAWRGRIIFGFFSFENRCAKSSSAAIRAVCRIDMPTVKTRLVVSTRKGLVSCGKECLTKSCLYSHKNGIYLVTSDESASNDNSLAYIWKLVCIFKYSLLYK